VKTLNAAIAAELAKKQGIEPVCIVEIQWVENGQYIAYSDQEYPEEPSLRGDILNISTLESVVKLDQSGQSQSIALSLSDVNGDIKSIIDVSNIHGRTVNVYQWVRGLPLSEKVLLYQGEVNGPIEWNSGDRTMRFEVVTQLANKEVGFSPEQGLFADIPNALVGRAWPIVFGLNQNVPAISLQEIPRTSTLQPVNVPDPTIAKQIAFVEDQIRHLQGAFQFYILALLQAQFTCDFDGDQAACAIADSLEQTVANLGVLIGQAQADLAALKATLADQEAESDGTLTVADGDKYPQGQTISLIVENTDGSNVQLTGSFSGSTFNIDSSTPTEYNDNLFQPGDVTPYGFTFVQAGATIRVESDTDIRFIAALNRTDVKTVNAFRGTGGNRGIATVPTSIYTVEYVALGPFTVTMLNFSQAPKDYNSSFENKIYVTQEDTEIGSNTVDILEWLITTFTDLEIDAASFATVNAQLENYPSHFALLEQWNILELLESILFQSRTVGYVSNNTVYLKYLPLETSATTTIEDSDVKVGSVRMLSTPTEEVVTKLVANWSDDYALEDEHRYILRHNVPLYGTRERTIDFFIYNIPELVIKSATFWLIRMANVWKRAKFKTYLNKLEMETFDTVSVELTGDFFATGNTKGIVTEVTYDPTANELDCECWLPVKFGTMDQYLFAWPSDADVSEFFPQASEIPLAGSDSPQKDVEGDSTSFGDNSINIQVQNSARVQRNDFGEEIPSDTNDTKPTPALTGSIFFQGGGTSPNFVYDYADYPFEATTPEATETTSTVFPCVVVSGSGDTYVCDVYENGLSNAATSRTITQLQIAGTSSLPAGSWNLAVKNNVLDGNGDIESTEWSMQHPVWL